LDLLAEHHPPAAHDERLKLSPVQFARAGRRTVVRHGSPWGRCFLISIDHELDGFTIDQCSPPRTRSAEP